MTPEFIQQVWPYGITAVILMFIAGIYYITVTLSLIRAFIGVELLVKAVTLLIIMSGYMTGNTALAQALVITIIVIEVVVMAVAVGIILCIYRNNKSIDPRELTDLKG